MRDVFCRFCSTKLEHTLVDLGASPLANSYISPEDSLKAEPFFELHAYVCSTCLLVQIPAVEAPENIFNASYAYYSSMSDSVLAHSRRYVAEMIDRFGLGPLHQVIEVASNDGYLLQYFRGRGVPVLGIEPSRNVAEAATAAGIPSVVRFFGQETARDLVRDEMRADLLIGNNVLAHVPDINDFVGGLKILLAPGGVITMEFPHLLQLIRRRYYDTIYHEHFSYLSLLAVERIFAHHGLKLFDVEEIAPQGGSLRIFACHAENPHRAVSHRVKDLRDLEISEGLASVEEYRLFGEEVHRTKRELLRFLITARDCGKTVVGYGAPAKGNTLLNFCGIKTDLLPYTVDVSPHKQGKLLPGTRVPIHSPDKIFETRPDYVLILPWNITDEVVSKMSGIEAWGGRFVVPLPDVRVLPTTAEAEGAVTSFAPMRMQA
ncbi:class I SAM-dependent methyltransferase [Chthonobacter rhizosphaerae]|uniref:class I SAM-dependent methyltransferase n=1 Tax=Chthonobacter rhizosphaerae TaxID=2735553 RepID=UPI0015EE7F12|nr:class I SAM-dependent methyltransferase [Chthonobacter rhizosphaerae]